jgi:hypothetical protein
MMTLDDDRLAALLGSAAEAFEVPESGPAEILVRADPGALAGDGAGDGAGADAGRADGSAEAEEDTPFDPPWRAGRLVVVARRHRVLSVAASVVVVLVAAGTIGAVVRSTSTPTPPAVASLKVPPKTPGGALSPNAPSFGTQATTTTSPANGHSPLSQDTTGAGSAGAPSTGGAAGKNSTSGGAPGLPAGAVGQSTKIEQTGTLGLTVKRGDLARTMARLTGLASAYGGFVANSQSQSGSSGGTPYGTITLQVPVDNFAAVVKSAEHYGKSTNVSTKATDVTGQYVDLQARLSALEASRQQYLTILAKATSIGDILSIQEQIDNIQQQIEQLQGQLHVLTSETSYSTVNVTVSEEGAPPRSGPLPESGLVRAWHDSVGGFVAGVEGVVRIAGPFLFALLCLAVVVVGGRVLWRRYQRHRL